MICGNAGRHIPPLAVQPSRRCFDNNYTRWSANGSSMACWTAAALTGDSVRKTSRCVSRGRARMRGSMLSSESWRVAGAAYRKCSGAGAAETRPSPPDQNRAGGQRNRPVLRRPLAQSLVRLDLLLIECPLLSPRNRVRGPKVALHHSGRKPYRHSRGEYLPPTIGRSSDDQTDHDDERVIALHEWCGLP